VYRLKILGLALMSVLALSVIASATASAALPRVLNEVGEEVAPKFEGTSGATEFAKLNKKTFICAASTAEGQFEKGKPLGLFHIHFTGCTISSGACTGEGDGEKEILVLGTFHIVYDKLLSEGSLGAAILFLIPRFHYTCTVTGLKILMLVQGEVLCLLKSINTFAKHFEVVCEQKEVGDPGEATYWNDEGKAINIKEGLLGEENTGKFEMSSESGAGLILTTENVEIMA